MTSDQPVDWEMFFRGNFSREWLLTPANVTSAFRDGAQYCRLCDSHFQGLPAEHIAGHAEELEVWDAQRRQSRPERVRSATPEQTHDLQARARQLRADGLTLRQIAEAARGQRLEGARAARRDDVEAVRRTRRALTRPAYRTALSGESHLRDGPLCGLMSPHPRRLAACD